MYQSDNKDRRFIRVSSKRQITLPISFVKALGIEEVVECILREDALLVRPFRSGTQNSFPDLILARLLDKGLAGRQLLDAFRTRNGRIRPELEKLFELAEGISTGRTLSASVPTYYHRPLYARFDLRFTPVASGYLAGIEEQLKQEEFHQALLTIATDPKCGNPLGDDLQGLQGYDVYYGEERHMLAYWTFKSYQCVIVMLAGTKGDILAQLEPRTD